MKTLFVQMDVPYFNIKTLKLSNAPTKTFSMKFSIVFQIKYIQEDVSGNDNTLPFASTQYDILQCEMCIRNTAIISPDSNLLLLQQQ